MRKRGPLSAETRIKVPFYDVDTLHVAWHGHYAKYLEEARCELLDRIRYNYDAMRADGYAWPVIDLRIRYARPARFGQMLTVRAELVEWQNRLVVHYLITDADTGERLTRAATTQVAVLIATGEMQLVTPTGLIQAIEAALNEEKRA